jgi:hypothetical protein
MHKGGCDLTEETHFGYGPPVAQITDPLMGKLLPVDEVRRHMREEHVNLSLLLAS